ncbi:MAG TPA: coniferyl aldehyde dehydrogenase [Xanthobacteraceae bacterium]|nr:coniferyl aldehyde dehydrogenase [Xanthobacteraceae bacterium]
MADAFEALRAATRADVNPPLALRQDRLRRLAALLARHEREFAADISADFGHRSRHETQFAEALVVEASIKHALRHLARWMKPRRVPTQLHFRPGANRLLALPLGVVGIVAPWNYPLQLSLAPLVGALAAGNRAMVKPSELVPRFSARLAQAVGAYFNPTEVAIVLGGPDIGERFVALGFDHLLFTGSTRVGRRVAQAAAENLTPVTLELGGKSPAIIDPSADLALAARRIAFGKLVNAGQTCIAPDYVLCPRDLQETFVRLFFAAAARLYGADPRNPDYTAIVNATHYARLEGLVADARAKGARIETAAGDIAAWKAVGKFPPYVVLDATDDMLLCREEIFGPILPVLAADDAEAAIAYVNGRDRPLALYWFGADRRARDRVLFATVAGGVTVNDCLLHIAQENQPFGGVGASGMGAYHGRWGFRAMSKEKPVFYQARYSGTDLLLPPYGATFDRVIGLVRRLL